MKTLIVVDMQNDFIDGALGTKEAVAIVPNVKKKIAEYIANGDKVLYTRDSHDEDYMETNEGKHLPVKHCIIGSYGWKVSDEVENADCVHIDKPNFGWTGWYDFHPELAMGDVEIVGLCTDICVVSNALILKAMFPEINISVDASCCAGVTPESHKAALLTMKMCQIEVTNMED